MNKLTHTVTHNSDNSFTIHYNEKEYVLLCYEDCLSDNRIYAGRLTLISTNDSNLENIAEKRDLAGAYFSFSKNIKQIKEEFAGHFIRDKLKDINSNDI